MSTDRRTLELPGDVVDRIEARLPQTEFDSAEGYVTYVLEEVLFEIDAEPDMPEPERVDEGQVRERLESLGYLNE